LAIAAAAMALLASLPAHASLLSGDALAKAANIVAIVVLVVVPIAVIVVFWLVHVLPEKIAHKNHHPQTKAIQVLCLLSLVFGGMLWPLAWLWAYTKPVLYKMAYGTDKADEYYEKLAATDDVTAERLRSDIVRLRADFDTLIARGGAPAEFEVVRDRLAEIEPRLKVKTEGAG
jgi:CBS domain containing-hemolysin-like protein